MVAQIDVYLLASLAGRMKRDYTVDIPQTLAKLLEKASSHVTTQMDDPAAWANRVTGTNVDLPRPIDKIRQDRCDRLSMLHIGYENHGKVIRRQGAATAPKGGHGGTQKRALVDGSGEPPDEAA